MANNLFISYELGDWDKNFEAVAAEIEKLGTFAQVQSTIWYAKSDLSSEAVCNAIWAVMDKENDSLIVVDTANNTAHWQNLQKEVAEFFQSEWDS